MDIKKQEEAEDISESIEMIDVMGMEIKEAKEAIKDLGLEVEIEGEGEMVVDQLPKKGIQINTGTKITIYTQ